ncbi:hypothetical protein DNTS_018793 [Danionella cerebrum]|uniref:Fibronectin type-III domain-containing protein n=1 Tax=Danionella cerebrum TaxID=2873325 RepID=A0A553QN65_9TELE|nr:hypothetical protein DNTS_018793 [Danionella translucida]
MMWKSVCIALCLLLASVKALDAGPSYGVKLCGREFIRAVIFTCGGSRWKRSLTNTDEVLDLFNSYDNTAADVSVLYGSASSSQLAPDSNLSPLAQAEADGTVFRRPARSLISEEVLEALRSVDRKGRDVVVGLSNACCKWGCSSFGVDVHCWWNQALPVGPDVSVVCQKISQDSASKCGLCQLYVTPHQLLSTCGKTQEAFDVSVATQHRKRIRCLCNGDESETCNVTVQGATPPSPPSRPNCVIEAIEDESIRCSWTNSNEPVIQTTYTLHWRDYKGKITSRESDDSSVVISRLDYMKSSQMTAWVTARNLLGDAQSEESDFDTEHIIRPEPPFSLNHTLMPLEISWTMDCEFIGPLDKECQVQYRMETEMQDWVEVNGFQVTFPLEDSQPFRPYSFRVRCHCGYEERIMSNWSAVYSLQTPPAAPVGELDVWSNCSSHSDKTSCNIYWKEMPLSQARGEVFNYIVMLKFLNGSEVIRNNGDQQHFECSCPQIRSFTLQPGVLGVFVSANTSMGSSKPTLVAFSVWGESIPEVNLSIRAMNGTLFVSWSVHPQSSEAFLGYVVQHVSVTPNHSCLNWVRVNRTQNFVLLADLHVKSISHSSVTLAWSPIPVHESKGEILYYLVGTEKTESRVNSKRTSVDLSDLQPRQQYQAWLSAVSSAGEGTRSFTTFSTIDSHQAVAIYLHPLWPLLCSPSEMDVKISKLEIVENPHPHPPETEPERVSVDVECQHFPLPHRRCSDEEAGGSCSIRNVNHESWSKCYSEMVDTDEEDAEGSDGGWGSSGYENHFMPSVDADKD